MKHLPTSWPRAADALDALSIAFDAYAVARKDYAKHRNSVTWYEYISARRQLDSTHKAWKLAMSKMIQGRQL